MADAAVLDRDLRAVVAFDTGPIRLKTPNSVTATVLSMADRKAVSLSERVNVIEHNLITRDAADGNADDSVAFQDRVSDDEAADGAVMIEDDPGSSAPEIRTPSMIDRAGGHNVDARQGKACNVKRVVREGRLFQVARAAGGTLMVMKYVAETLSAIDGDGLGNVDGPVVAGIGASDLAAKDGL